MRFGQLSSRRKSKRPASGNGTANPILQACFGVRQPRLPLLYRYHSDLKMHVLR